ncbi:MAG: hypothetical protein A3C93_00090 [Candidatus Lloydbacteria bacterium RIFCSPHIGHO2_02_FULL_54_17]|uniref:Acyl-CoA dehydrogenase n=1 Tax=Candidatus Lloydbacteria bacterium RIFCSPHIGHO2_02_FULL_54_17 TaxID=1798664 RepID=A0A1G2DIH3_9BACT|nr:MAG: hypothetical protein A2762_03840 [Candidatus Lloydbacteria bacterium RIFCSPHIGHO2_01_FULL_54_11]OGZ13303.1 MAG: hypothetical protein A3C93_00090 [Candidatus Lloydbacteria bacterium RIFCSPHIGHO2_02_FULL_54_17]OGZ17111.1 MAG: hypothetical protein A3H76_02890 [Candidatus Lloydbacteria bacterium RIFCSPLOWO2_02_FULL_54_12]
MRWQEPKDETLSILLESVRRFGKEEIEPAYGKYEEQGFFPAELVKKMGAMGLFGLMIPEEYGGSGMGTVAASFVARELAYRWPALHLIWTANSSLAAFPIAYAGTKEQKARILPQLASGEILGCYALTEPNSGSDAGSMTMKAEWRPDSLTWSLNGSKIFITNAFHASVAVVFARTSKKSISAFLVESSEPGLRHPGVTVRYIPKRVQKSSDFCEIHCNDVFLPVSALLGKEGKGFAIAMQTLDGGRINIAAQAIGMAMRVFDDAYAYVHVRKQFGRLVWENQKVQFDFAEAYARLIAAWALVIEASERRDAGENITRIASSAKLVATETAWKVASDLETYFGGMAFTQESAWLPRLLDIAPTRVYEGANNIQHMVIAKHLDD